MATDAAPIFDEVDYPFPPRFRWLKRMIVVYLLLAATLVGVRVWWGKLAQRRLDAGLAAIRATGEPAIVADMNQPAIRNADNAAYYYNQAILKLNANVVSPAASNYTYNGYPPFSRKWYAMAEASAAANQPAFDLAREGRKHPRVQWSTNYASPLVNFLLPHLNGLRNVANHVGDNALLLHLKGNDAEAIESIKDIWAMAHASEQQSFLISHLVAVGIRALALNRLEIIATELTVEGRSPTTRPTDHPATRKQIDELLAMILDEEAEHAAAAHAYAGERLLQLDAILYYPKASKMLWPMFQLDAVASMHDMDGVIATATQPTWPTSIQAMSAAPRPNVASTLAHALSRAIAPSLGRARQTDFRVVMEARLAAAIIAVRLYRLDHNGQFPPTLEALVPAYLPKVPDDPFTAPVTKIGYVPPGKAPHPLVYSVAEDDFDNTRAGTKWPSEPENSWNPKSPDQWRDLTRWSPPPKPKSTQPMNPGDELEQTLEDE
jgi:hypothetical protein